MFGRVQANFDLSLTALRLAMNAARRLPRVQGSWADSPWDVLITDLIKRAFVICLVLCSGLCGSFARLRINMAAQSGRYWAVAYNFMKNSIGACGKCVGVLHCPFALFARLRRVSLMLCAKQCGNCAAQSAPVPPKSAHGHNTMAEIRRP